MRNVEPITRTSPVQPYPRMVREEPTPIIQGGQGRDSASVEAGAGLLWALGFTGFVFFLVWKIFS
jgi:hypothetical protein